MKVLIYNKADNRYYMFKKTDSLISYLNSVNREDVEIISLGGPSRSRMWSRITPEDAIAIGIGFMMISSAILLWPVMLHYVGVF